MGNMKEHKKGNKKTKNVQFRHVTALKGIPIIFKNQFQSK